LPSPGHSLDLLVTSDGNIEAHQPWALSAVR